MRLNPRFSLAIFFFIATIALLMDCDINPAKAGQSSTTFGVSLVITAGCSAVTNATRPDPVSIKCDNVVPYRVQTSPAEVIVLPETGVAGAKGINIMVVY